MEPIEFSVHTSAGQRLINLSYYKGRVVVDVRFRSFKSDTWEPCSELVLPIYEWNRLVQKSLEWDLALEVALEEDKDAT